MNYINNVYLPSSKSSWIIPAWRILCGLSVKQALFFFFVFRHVSFLFLFPFQHSSSANNSYTYTLCSFLMQKQVSQLSLSHFSSFWTSPENNLSRTKIVHSSRCFTKQHLSKRIHSSALKQPYFPSYITFLMEVIGTWDYRKLICGQFCVT